MLAGTENKGFENSVFSIARRQSVSAARKALDPRWSSAVDSSQDEAWPISRVERHGSVTFAARTSRWFQVKGSAISSV
jgi:hypothetical protein